MRQGVPKIRLRQWIWRAFLSSALIPLILVETVLIASYLLTNQVIREAQVDYLKRSAVDSLSASVEQNALIVESKLEHLTGVAGLLGTMTEQALLTPASVPGEVLAVTPEGARYSATDLGGAASFYSAATPLALQDLDKVRRLASLDTLFKQIRQADPMIASLYFNSWDSYNRIYPWFRTNEQYPADIRIPEFNFYYLADATHNPQKATRWTEVYLDPAGHGWMMSAVSPVYRGDFLEGVVGLDITVDGMLNEIAHLRVPWSGYLLLVSNEMTIMAMPPQAEDDFGMSELKAPDAKTVVSGNVLKPRTFNLGQRDDAVVMANELETADSGFSEVTLQGRPHLFAWRTIKNTGWRLVALAEKEDVMAETYGLARHFRNIGYLMIVGLVLFYIVFFTVLWRRSRKLSERLRQPISGIVQMLREIGQGRWQPARVESGIAELDEMAGNVLTMGSQLATSEQQRHVAQERLALVMENASTGLWEYHLDDDSLTLRGGLVVRLELPETSMSREAFLARLDANDARAVMQAFDSLRMGQTSRIDIEFRLSRPDGSFLWLLGRGRMIKGVLDGGNVAVGTLVDIDALKLTEMELRERTLQAQAASQAKSRFISSMSHELRTPLNAIQGFTQLMRMGARHETDEQHLDEILGATTHLAQLVDDLLDWSSLQAEPQKLTLKPVPVRSILKECADMVRSQAMAAGLLLELELELTDTPAEVYADARRLRQVLLNLLSNAIKYNRPGGRLLIGALRVGEWIRLFVEDGGLGIEPALQTALFEPFQRLGKENTAIQGTGIGLALCRELAGLMGGQMGLSSEPGKGSRFWIDLVPTHLVEPSGIREKRRTAIFYAGNDESILPFISTIAGERATLKSGTLEGCVVDSGTEGAPGILLLDCDDENTNRSAQLGRLRRSLNAEFMSVVLLGSAPKALAWVGFEFQAVLKKPLEVEALREVLDALLEKESSNVH
ncbi:histidine kinase,histidine kinase,cache domain-containing protein [Pseudomonas asplenii]|uniref:histidine kinase n=1 Tax=Pseudomonas asplenii TaxID=53407 RepID=A0A0M9GG28_9PSED|nr:sensor histidine kinase [Pseudomonas fuscovaginae]KPA90374.1 histidine kinase,histidine kinase,cache domain-containing protein [Pseudomonas fuscovaginae]